MGMKQFILDNEICPHKTRETLLLCLILWLFQSMLKLSK